MINRIKTYRWVLSAIILPLFIVGAGWAMTCVFATQSSVVKECQEVNNIFIDRLNRVEEQVIGSLNKIHDAQLEIVQTFGVVNSDIKILKTNIQYNTQCIHKIEENINKIEEEIKK